MEEDQISCFERSKSSAISGSRGDIANQMKKAIKKDHHEQ